MVPAELCEILANQPFRGKLSENHTAAMIRYACNPPAVNAHSIVDEGLHSLGLTGPSQSLNAFEVSVSPQMAVIPARVLDPPRVAYARNQNADVNKDKASWNLQRVKFFKAQRLANWGAFIIKASPHDFEGPDDPNLRAVLNEFQKVILC